MNASRILKANISQFGFREMNFKTHISHTDECRMSWTMTDTEHKNANICEQEMALII